MFNIAAIILHRGTIWLGFVVFISIFFVFFATLFRQKPVIFKQQRPAFVPLPLFNSTAVNPNDILSRVPRIKEYQLTDLSPDCLKHPSNGVDQDCWNAFRRQQYLQVLEALYGSPENELERFFPHHKWQIFDIITPTYQCDSNSLRRIGSQGDGGKWICGPIRVLGPKCVIFSLGSNNQFDFEEAIDKYTRGKCEIHTFDCTGVWSNPHTKYHPWCPGGFDGKDEQGRTFKRLSTVAKELGITSISLLKMDKYEVFESLKHEPEEFLPDQILFELHIAPFPTGSSLARAIIDLVRDIDSMGYSFAIQEKNLLCEACSEYVIVRDRPSTINPKKVII